MAIITLLTDFGNDDTYVGEMKGAVLAIHPRAVLVDLAHTIAPGAVRAAAWLLAHAWESFPEGTIHVAVVDPGVGSGRRALAARVHGHWFLAPDNGLLHPILDRGKGETRAVRAEHRTRSARGTTFDGRDLFAPVAASLAEGMSFEDVGPAVQDAVRLEPFRPIHEDGTWRAEIVRADRFGNLVTTAREAFLKTIFGDEWRRVRVSIGGREVANVQVAYEAVPHGSLLLSIGSAGTLEISCRGGSARDVLGVEIGHWVQIRLPSETSAR
jgi:S-adenosylmethionine hydrolase